MTARKAGKPDASTGSGTPAPRVGRLDTLPRCRRELARLYRDARGGRLDAQTAARLASIVAMIGRLIEGGELEARLAALEEQQATAPDGLEKKDWR